MDKQPHENEQAQQIDDDDDQDQPARLSEDDADQPAGGMEVETHVHAGEDYTPRPIKIDF